MNQIIHPSEPDIWYFPSAFGDIRLEQVEGKTESRVIWYELTPLEAEALENLRKSSLHWRRKWTTADAWKELGDADAFKVGDRTEHHIVLNAKIGDIAKILNKGLNPERRTVNVVRIGQGKIEEITTFAAHKDEEKADVKADGVAEADPYRSPQTTPPAEPTTALATVEKPSKPAKKEEITKAATVKEPTLGCPPPDFAAIRRRATRILKAFLTPTQIADFEERQSFIVRGADTGHLYRITSRNAPDELRRFGRRQVFDLNEGCGYCVHDYDIPAEEELLSIALLLQLPLRENWIRKLPDLITPGFA